MKERGSASDGEGKLHKPSHARFLQRSLARVGWGVGLALCAWLLLGSARAIVATFHWAERRVVAHSPLHQLLALAVTFPLSLGLPIPLVHQAWAVAIGCFFKWRALPILFAAMAIGVPLPFTIGRRLAAAYLTPLRAAITAKPIRSSFLLMWAPLPTSFLPLLIGFLMSPTELTLQNFVLGALPSKLLHFACDVLVGIEAGSLSAALDAHDDFPGMDDLEGHASNRIRARRIAIGVMVLAVLFMLGMLHTMHSALKSLKGDRKAQEEDVEGWRHASSISPV